MREVRMARAFRPGRRRSCVFPVLQAFSAVARRGISIQRGRFLVVFRQIFGGGHAGRQCPVAATSASAIPRLDAAFRRARYSSISECGPEVGHSEFLWRGCRCGQRVRIAGQCGRGSSGCRSSPPMSQSCRFCPSETQSVAMRMSISAPFKVADASARDGGEKWSRILA